MNLFDNMGRGGSRTGKAGKSRSHYLATFLLFSLFGTGVAFANPSGLWYQDMANWFPGQDDNTQTITISTASELAGLARMVNNWGSDFAGYTVILANDIDLSAHYWVPIGVYVYYSQYYQTQNYFKGTFDGAGHTISGLYINTAVYNTVRDASYAGDHKCEYFGLFGVSDGGMTIKNLNVELDANTTTYTGGLIGYVRGGQVTITNCKVQGDMVTTKATGGMIGCMETANVSITYCVSDVNVTNRGTASVSGNSDYSGNVGGMIGLVGTTETADLYIDYCYNLGNLSNCNRGMAMLGMSMKSNNVAVTINNSYNYYNSSLGKGVLSETLNSTVVSNNKKVGFMTYFLGTQPNKMRKFHVMNVYNVSQYTLENQTVRSLTYKYTSHIISDLNNYASGALAYTMNIQNWNSVTENYSASFRWARGENYPIIASSSGAPYAARKITYIDADGVLDNTYGYNLSNGTAELQSGLNYYTDAACTVTFNPSTIVTSDLTLYYKDNSLVLEGSIESTGSSQLTATVLVGTNPLTNPYNGYNVSYTWKNMAGVVVNSGTSVATGGKIIYNGADIQSSYSLTVTLVKGSSSVTGIFRYGTVVFVDYTAGADYRDGRTPVTAVKTMLRAYQLIKSENEGGTMDNNKIVLIGTYPNETGRDGNSYLFGHADDINSSGFTALRNNFSKPVTVTGVYDNVDYNAHLGFTSEWNTGRFLFADTRFEHLVFYSGSQSTPAGTYVYCQGKDLFIGNGVSMQYYNLLNQSDGLATVDLFTPLGQYTPDFHIMGGFLNYSPTSYPDAFNAADTCDITLLSGAYARVLGSSRTTAGQHVVFGSIANPFNVKLNIGESGSEESLLVNLLLGGQTDGSAATNATIFVKNGVVGRIIGGNIGLGHNVTAVPKDNFYGKVVINLQGGRIFDLVGTSLGRYSGALYFYGTVDLNISGQAVVENNVFAGGAGSVTGWNDNYPNSEGSAWATYRNAQIAVLDSQYVKVNMTGGVVNGSVYGGGYGYARQLLQYTYANNSYYGFPVDNGHAMQNCSNFVLSNVQEDAGAVYCNTYVNIAGGVVNGNVYGGGIGSDKIERLRIAGGLSGSYTSLAQVYGNSYVNITGGRIVGQVMGGGAGVEIYSNMARTNGDIYVSIYKGSHGDAPWLENNVFGGGEFAAVQGNTNLFFTDGQASLSIFGGGQKGLVNGSTTVRLNGGVVNGDIYGGGLFGDVVMNTAVTVSGGECHNILGGSFFGDIGGTTNAHLLGDALVTGSVYGGNAVSGQIGDNGTNVVINGGTVQGDVYGGGNGNYPGYYSVDTAMVSSFGVDYTGFLRPSVSRASVTLAGTASTPVVVQGAVYGGGNSTTVGLFDLNGNLQQGSGSITVSLGSYADIGELYLGSNGEYLIDGYDNYMWNDGSADHFGSFQNIAAYSLYLSAVNVACVPVLNIDNSATDLTVGSLFIGGNMCSMTTNRQLAYTLPESLTITEKIVGGSFETNQTGPATGGGYLAYRGGVITPNSGVDAGKPKIKLSVSSTFEPKVMSGLYKGGNIYGGCYASGYVEGDVEIQLFSDMIPDQAKSQGTAADMLELSLDQHDAFSVFGGGYGLETYINGSTIVTLNEGVTVGNVFGGGYYGSVGYVESANDTVFNSTYVYIKGGTCYGDVFAGSDEGYVLGSTHILVGECSYYVCKVEGMYYIKTKDQNNQALGTVVVSGQIVRPVRLKVGDYISKTMYSNLLDGQSDFLLYSNPNTLTNEISILRGIYGGGNMRYGSNDIYASTSTVSGNSCVIIHENPDADMISISRESAGGVYSDGKLTLVSGYRSIEVENYGLNFSGIANNNIIKDMNGNPVSLKLINCFQRADLLSIINSSIVLYDARDFSLSTPDGKTYSLTRIGELQILSDLDKTCRVAFRNPLLYLASLYSNVSFDETYYDVDGNMNNSYSYKSWKVAKHDGSSEDQKKQNVGYSRNQIAVDNGNSLLVFGECDLNLSSYYGPINGVVQLFLWNSSAGEGGGYVYADNNHQDNLNPWLNSSGNFIFGGDESKVIVDNCYPNRFENGGVDSEAHFWYVKGTNYTYNLILTTYTKGTPNSNRIDPEMGQIVLPSATGSLIGVERLSWKDHSFSWYDPVEPYNSHITNNPDYSMFMVEESDSSQLFSLLPHNGTSQSGDTIIAAPTSQTWTTSSPDPIVNFVLNLPANSDNYNNLKEGDSIRLILSSSEQIEGTPLTYTFVIKVVVIDGPKWNGELDIHTLPGGVIEVSPDDIPECEYNDLLPVTGYNWRIVPKNADNSYDYDNSVQISSGIEFPSNLTAFYYQNGYLIRLVALTPKGEYELDGTLYVHNYHKMKDVVSTSAWNKTTDGGIEKNAYMWLTEGCKVYIEDTDDLGAFREYINSPVNHIDYQDNYSGRYFNPAGGEGIEFIINNDLTVPSSWSSSESVGTLLRPFLGNIHGNGHIVSLTDKPLFGIIGASGKTVSFYNLGINGLFTSGGLTNAIGAGVVNLENCFVYSLAQDCSGNPFAATVDGGANLSCINTFYQADKFNNAPSQAQGVSDEEFNDGTIAYALNSYYINKSNGFDSDYLDSYYSDGDYLLVDVGEWRLAQVDVNGIHKYNKDKGYDYDRAVDEYGDLISVSDNDNLFHHYSPLFPQDYIMFGQTLSYGNFGQAHDSNPVYLNTTNRVYAADAYKSSLVAGETYFNRNAVLSNVDLTAVDFTNSDLGSDNLTGFALGGGLTKNLLVYANADTDFNVIDNVIGYTEATLGDPQSVMAHAVKYEYGTYSMDYLNLVDKQMFHCPISFAVNSAEHYRETSVNGLGTLILPFIPNTTHNDYYELTSRTPSYAIFDEVFEPSANVPYLFIRKDTHSIFEGVPTGTSVIVERTQGSMVRNVNALSMVGIFKRHVFNTDNVYFIKDDKMYHNNGGTVTFNPFRAYFTNDEPILAPSLSIRLTSLGEQVPVDDIVNQTPLVIFSKRGAIGLKANQDVSVTIYSTGGQQIFNGDLKIGEEKVVTLLPAVYIVNGIRVLVR